MALTKTQVSQLYVAIFNRASEGEGNTYWQTAVEGMAATATEMLATDAAKTYFGTSLDTDQAFIEHIYKNTLGKTYEDDKEGIDYWVSLLADGMSKGEVVAALIVAAQDPANAGAAQDMFNNKVIVSDYTATKIEKAEVTELKIFQDLISGVTADGKTVTTAKAAVAKAAEPDEPEIDGDVFELTSGTDKLVGTDKNDFFDASIAQNSFTGGVSNTLSSADKLDGGAGTDTLHAEIVPEFYGATSDRQIDVQPKTTSIENVTFEAREFGSNDQHTEKVSVDAKNMYGVNKIGSKFSDGDLIIENLTTLASDGKTIRHTKDMTITMDHTDDSDHDRDASDLKVLFDEDYLNTTTSISGSTLTVKINNVLNIAEGTNPVENFTGINFTVGTTAVSVDITGATTYAEVVSKINAQLAAQGLTTVSASLGTAQEVAFSMNIGAYNTGAIAGTFNPIVITNTGSEALVKGTIDLAQGQTDGDINNTWTATAATELTNPISIKIELEKVGRDGEGGDLIVGAKGDDSLGHDTDVDQKDGIEIFNITVKGDDSKPSNLGNIASTNDYLTTVNIVSETRTDDSYADLTVRNLLGEAGQELLVIDAAAFKGDFSLAMSGEGQQAITSTFGIGDDSYKWLSTEDDNVKSDKAYSIDMGAGDDTLIAHLDGDSVDAIGESFAITTGTGNDTVTLTGDKEVSDETTLYLDNVNVTLGAGEDTLFLNTEIITKVVAGSESDFVVVDANNSDTDGTVGTWQVGTGSESVAGSWDARVLYEATLTVDFAGFEQEVIVKTTAANKFIATQEDINNAIIAAIEANPELSRLLTTEIGKGTDNNQILTITSTVQGINDLTISVNQPTIVRAAGAVTGQTTISSNEYVALEAGLLETGVVDDSNDIDATDTEGDIITALNGIAGNLNQTGAVAANDFVLDSADVTDGTNNTNATSNAIIDMGTGANDLVVLDSDVDSSDTIVFSAAWDKVSIVNFFNAQYNDQDDAAAAANDTVIDHTDSTPGSHVLDFTAWLNDSLTASGSTESAIRVDTAQDIVATTADLNLGSNEVVIVNDWTNGGDTTESWSAMTAAAIDASLEGTDLYGSLVATTAVADDADNLETGISSILMIENDANQGEYKVFNVETNAAAADGSQFTVTLLGIIDFGESYTEDSNGASDNINFAGFIA